METALHTYAATVHPISLLIICCLIRSYTFRLEVDYIRPLRLGLADIIALDQTGHNAQAYFELFGSHITKVGLFHVQ